MFEVGKTYEFRVLEDGGDVTFTDTVERYEFPLLKLVDLPERRIPVRLMPSPGPGRNPEESAKLPARPGQIINVTSPNFVSAVEKVD